MNLKELRKHKELTQEEASSICNIPLRSYKRLENNPSYAGCLKYQSALQSLEEYKRKKTSNNSNNILVIGAGYVGLSLAVLLSSSNNVSIVDIKENIVEMINKRQIIFKDKEIEKYYSTKKLNLHAYLPNINLYRNCDYVIVAIPTDFSEETNLLDTSNVRTLVEEIREANKKALIVIKSTCTVGFTDSLNDKNIIYCPEFLREGRALLDNLYPNRIIIGGDKSNNRVKRFGNLLQRATLNRAKLLYMSYKEAEAVKLFSNAYLAMRVAYFNELDSFAIANGIDAKNIVDGVSLDKRIGDYYNNPSFGYGGYCLPKDTLSLINQMKRVNNSNLLTSIDNSNQSRKEFIAKDIIRKLRENGGSTIGVFSTQSKKDSDNTRHSSILDVISILKDKGVNLIYYENDLDSFKQKSDIILTNRYDSSLDDVKDKVYTRDLYSRD